MTQATQNRGHGHGTARATSLAPQRHRTASSGSPPSGSRRGSGMGVALCNALCNGLHSARPLIPDSGVLFRASWIQIGDQRAAEVVEGQQDRDRTDRQEPEGNSSTNASAAGRKRTPGRVVGV